jgi:CHAT domain-containing protein
MESETDEEQETDEQEVDGPFPGLGGADIERLRQEHTDILQRIEQLNPELASLININPLQASEIQDLLDADTALLAYYVGWDVNLVFVVTREQVTSVGLETSREKLLDGIQRFRTEAVEEISVDGMASKGYAPSLSELYASLIQPVEERIAGKRHLVIVPHGILHYLPFQALLRKGPDGAEGYLIESFTISYLPSASLLRFVRMKAGGRKEAFLAVGNPATGLASLPAAEVEAREVSALFQNRMLLTGQQATETSVKNEGPRFDMMLLSTHGEMIESDPLKSNLRFTPSTSDDGRLTVGEIFDMEVKADLVTLSACETGLARGVKGGFPTGDDLVGLSRAFIHAGTPSVVASLWKVSDDSTVALMRTFYGNLREMSKAEALRQAQLALMKSRLSFRSERGGSGITRSPGYQPGVTIDCSHPFFWAPFILVGDWQ